MPVCSSMRCLVRRVSSAAVRVEDEVVGKIGEGLLVYLGVQAGDRAEDVDWLIKKLIAMRLFSDSDGKMNVRGPSAVVQRLSQ